MDDVALVTAVQSGDELALADLFEECHVWGYSAALNALRDPEAAEEATARVFEAVITDRLAGASALRPAMIRLIHDACTAVEEEVLKPRRKRRREPMAAPDPSNLRLVAWRASGDLPAADRILFALAAGAGFTTEAIAAAVAPDKPAGILTRLGLIREHVVGDIIAARSLDDCPELRDTLRYAAKEPDQAARKRIAAHLTGGRKVPGCKKCNSTRDRWSLAALAALLPLTAIPAEVNDRLVDRMERALRATQPEATEPPSRPGEARSFTLVDGVVVFDENTTTAFTRLRSTPPPGYRPAAEGPEPAHRAPRPGRDGAEAPYRERPAAGAPRSGGEGGERPTRERPAAGASRSGGRGPTGSPVGEPMSASRTPHGGPRPPSGPRPPTGDRFRDPRPYDARAERRPQPEPAARAADGRPTPPGAPEGPHRRPETAHDPAGSRPDNRAAANGSYASDAPSDRRTPSAPPAAGPPPGPRAPSAPPAAGPHRDDPRAGRRPTSAPRRPEPPAEQRLGERPAQRAAAERVADGRVRSAPPAAGPRPDDVRAARASRSPAAQDPDVTVDLNLGHLAGANGASYAPGPRVPSAPPAAGPHVPSAPPAAGSYVPSAPPAPRVPSAMPAAGPHVPSAPPAAGPHVPSAPPAAGPRPDDRRRPSPPPVAGSHPDDFRPARDPRPPANRDSDVTADLRLGDRGPTSPYGPERRMPPEARAPGQRFGEAHSAEPDEERTIRIPQPGFGTPSAPRRPDGTLGPRGGPPKPPPPAPTSGRPAGPSERRAAPDEQPGRSSSGPRPPYPAPDPRAPERPRRGDAASGGPRPPADLPPQPRSGADRNGISFGEPRSPYPSRPDDSSSTEVPWQPHTGQRPNERPDASRAPHASQHMTGPHSGQRPPERPVSGGAPRPQEANEYPGRLPQDDPGHRPRTDEGTPVPPTAGTTPDGPRAVGHPGPDGPAYPAADATVGFDRASASVPTPAGPDEPARPAASGSYDLVPAAPDDAYGPKAGDSSEAPERGRPSGGRYPTAANPTATEAPDPRPTAASTRGSEAEPYQSEEAGASGWFTPKNAASPAKSADEWNGPRPAAGSAQEDEGKPGWFTPTQPRAQQETDSAPSPAPVSPAPVTLTPDGASPDGPSPDGGDGEGTDGPEDGDKRHRRLPTGVTLVAFGTLLVTAVAAANLGAAFGVN